MSLSVKRVKNAGLLDNKKELYVRMSVGGLHVHSIFDIFEFRDVNFVKTYNNNTISQDIKNYKTTCKVHRNINNR